MSGYKIIVLLAINLLLISANDCQYPLFYQFIQPFSLASADIQGVTSKELSKIQLQTFTNQNVTFSSIEASSTYNGSGRSLRNQGLMLNVVNDSLSFTMSFSVSFSKKKNYTVSAGVDKILVNYTKAINNKTEKLQIKNVAFQFAPTDINTHFFPENISKADLQKANNGIIGNSTTSIFNQLKKALSSLQGFMNDHVKTQSIGRLFPNGNYTYIPQNGYSVNFDLSSSNYTYYSEGSILENGLKGYIWNSTQKACSNSFQTKVGSNHTFITKQFALNLLTWGMKNLPSFNSINVERSKYKKSNFQFRLIDLQYVLPSALQKYPQKFLNQISFSCKAKQLNGFFIGGSNSHANITWSCFGYLMTSTEKIKIMQFSSLIWHNFQFKIVSKRFITTIKELKHITTQFVPVDDMFVVQPDVAVSYITSFLYSFQNYGIGSDFKIKQGTDTIIAIQDGIWLSTSSNISDI